MMMMTAKVSKKGLGLVLALVAGLVALIVLLSSLGGGTSDPAPGANTNDQRVSYLQQQGWQVIVSPVQTRQVRIPEELSEVFRRYNDLQVSQGFDLLPYAGKTVTQYVYEIETGSDPSNETVDPVYATLLVFDGQIIGGDVTDTSANGVVGPLVTG